MRVTVGLRFGLGLIVDIGTADGDAQLGECAQGYSYPTPKQ